MIKDKLQMLELDNKMELAQYIYLNFQKMKLRNLLNHVKNIKKMIKTSK